MSFRNRTGLCGLLIGCTVAIASACGGLDSVKVVITDDAGSGGNPSGGDGASGDGAGGKGTGGKPSGGDGSTEGGAAGALGMAGDVGTSGMAGEAGSGGEGGQVIIIPPDPQPGPPTVVSVSPRDQSTTAGPTDTIRISFSEPLDPATVTSDSVQIKDGLGAVVSGTLSYADAIASFTPKGRMNLLAGYTVNVTIAVTDAGKTPMERPFLSAFTVRDGGWGKTESALTNNREAFDRLSTVVLATDGGGRAVAAWAQATTSGSTYDIYAAPFNQGKGWATPVKVNSSALNCEYPAVSMNASGNFIVGWIEFDSTASLTQPYSVQARRNIAGTWDATSTRIDIASTSAYELYPENVVVAISANGHTHVAWDSWDNNTVNNDYGVFARHADANGLWDTSVTQLTYLQVSTGASAPALAFDGDGNGFAAYQFATGSPTKVGTMVQRYIAATNKWGTSAVASTPSDGYAQPVAVATNPAGDAILGWARATAIDASTNTYDLMGSSYNKAWNAPVVISAAKTSIFSTGGSKTMATAVWTGASFLVAWSQSGGTPNHIYANQFKGTTWGSATIISDGNHSSWLPWLTGDGRGNALAVWYQQSDTAATTTLVPTDVEFSRFVGSTDKWLDPARVSSAVAGYRFPQAITLADGSAVATFQSTLRALKITNVNGVLGNDFQ